MTSVAFSRNEWSSLLIKTCSATCEKVRLFKDDPDFKANVARKQLKMNVCDNGYWENQYIGCDKIRSDGTVVPMEGHVEFVNNGDMFLREGCVIDGELQVTVRGPFRFELSILEGLLNDPLQNIWLENASIRSCKCDQIEHTLRIVKSVNVIPTSLYTMFKSFKEFCKKYYGTEALCIVTDKLVDGILPSNTEIDNAIDEIVRFDTSQIVTTPIPRVAESWFSDPNVISSDDDDNVNDSENEFHESESDVNANDVNDNDVDENNVNVNGATSDDATRDTDDDPELAASYANRARMLGLQGLPLPPGPYVPFTQDEFFDLMLRKYRVVCDEVRLFTDPDFHGKFWKLEFERNYVERDEVRDNGQVIPMQGDISFSYDGKMYLRNGRVEQGILEVTKYGPYRFSLSTLETLLDDPQAHVWLQDAERYDCRREDILRAVRITDEASVVPSVFQSLYTSALDFCCDKKIPRNVTSVIAMLYDGIVPDKDKLRFAISFFEQSF